CHLKKAIEQPRCPCWTVTPTQIVKILPVWLVVEDRAGIALGICDRLQILRASYCRTQELLVSGLRIQRREEISYAGGAVQKVRHQTGNLGTLPPLDPAGVLLFKLNQPPATKRRKLAGGRIPELPCGIQQEQPGPCCAADDIRSVAPLDAATLFHGALAEQL